MTNEYSLWAHSTSVPGDYPVIYFAESCGPGKHVCEEVFDGLYYTVHAGNGLCAGAESSVPASPYSSGWSHFSAFHISAPQ